MKLVNTSLNKLIQDKNLTFLIGAGCSVNIPSCLPTGNEMMEDIIEFSCYERFKEDLKNLIDENELRFEQLVEIFTELIDKNLHCIDFFSECKYPNSIHLLLARMIEKGNFVITTNFDSLIEFALIKIGISRDLILPVITKDEFQLYEDPYENFKKSKFSIYKIHGSPIDIIKNTSKTELRQSLVITTKSFVRDKRGLNIFELEPYKQKPIENLLKNRTLIVMGYSGSDDFDILPTLESVDGINEIIWISHSSLDDTKIWEIEYTNADESHQDVDKFLSGLKMTKKEINLFKIEGITEIILSELELFEESEFSDEFNLKPFQWFSEGIETPSEIEKIQMSYLIFVRLSYFEKALICTQRILELSKIENKPYWQIIAYSNKGSIYEIQGNFTEALTYFDKAHEVIKNNPRFSKLLVIILYYKGIIFHNQGQLKKAHEIELEALKIAKNLKDENMDAHIFNSLGSITRDLGENDKAEDFFRSALLIFEAKNDPIGKAVILLKLAINYRDVGEFEEEYNHLRIATQIVEKLNSRYYLSSCYTEWGNYYLNIDDFEKVFLYNNKTYNLAIDLKNKLQQVEILGKMGNLLSRQGKLNEALEKYEVSSQINTEYGFITGKAINLEDMGYIYERKGDLSKAIEFYEEALEINEKSSNFRKIMKNYNSIGLAYHKKGRLEKSVSFYQKSQQMMKLVDDPTVSCIFYINMSSVLIDLSDYDKALENLKLAENICDKLPSKSNLMYFYAIHGKLREKKGAYTKAIFYYKKSLSLAEENKFKKEEAQYLNKLGLLYKKLDSLDKALKYYQKAFSIAETLNNHYGMANILYNSGHIHNKKGDFVQALKNLSKAKMMITQFNIKDLKLLNKIEKAILLTERNKRKSQNEF